MNWRKRISVKELKRSFEVDEKRCLIKKYSLIAKFNLENASNKKWIRKNNANFSKEKMCTTRFEQILEALLFIVNLSP